MKKRIPFTSVLLGATLCVVLLAPSTHAQVQWAKRFAGITDWPGGEPNIGLALDTNDNCYVTGFFDTTNNFGGVTLTNQSAGGSDIFVAQYNSAGTLQWVKRAGGSAGNLNNGREVGLDTNGNIYVTGGVYGPADFGSVNLPASPNEEFFLAKYNNAGVVQWVQMSAGGFDNVYGTGLAVDGAGNSYALLFVDNFEGGATISFGSVNVPVPGDESAITLLVKYDKTGTAQWAQLMGGTGEVYATKVAVDASGNAYVRGLFEVDMTVGTSNLLVSAGSTKNMFIAKFNNSGALAWVRQAQGGNTDEGGVAVDLAGNVYVSGAFDSNADFGGGIILTNAAVTSLFGDAFIAKYNSAGAIQWAVPAGGTNGGFYWDLALDAQTNIYAAGFLGSGAVVTKYARDGTPQWAYAASGPVASPVSSSMSKCVVDAAGHCFLDGFYQGTTGFGTNVLAAPETWNFFLARVATPTPPTLGIVLSNGVPRLSLMGTIGSEYSIQWSPIVAATNTPFQTLTTLTLTNSPQFQLDTSNPTLTNRFYRAGPPAL